jgi:hypothetical protein
MPRTRGATFATGVDTQNRQTVLAAVWGGEVSNVTGWAHWVVVSSALRALSSPCLVGCQRERRPDSRCGRRAAQMLCHDQARSGTSCCPPLPACPLKPTAKVVELSGRPEAARFGANR